MKEHLTLLEQENCDRNCAECWESDSFGNCFKKCENCEFDGSENCYFGQWCKYWDGHGNLIIPFDELPEQVQQTIVDCSIDRLVSDGDLPF